MDHPDGVVIVGAGHAGFTAAASLRQHGYTGPVTLIADEAALPYQRPPLSKAYLADKIAAARLAFRPAQFYTRKGIELRLGCRVEGIDRKARAVVLSSGESVGYSRLILATGSVPLTARIPGATLAGVFQIYSQSDADALRECLGAARRVVVVGGGFIGLEFAAHARGEGKHVTIVHGGDRLMARAVSPLISEFFRQQHLSWGSRVLLSTPVAKMVGSDGGHVRGVQLQDGCTLGADLVVVGVGVRANTELAECAGLVVGDGVVVDAALRTSDPHIFAIGDCASYPFNDRLARHECVENAVGHAHAVAKTLSTGEDQAYDRTPMFWSDQGDIKLQIAGDFTGHDRTVLEGDPADRSFSVHCYKDGNLIAVESVNRPVDHITGRELLRRRPATSAV